VSRQIKKGSTDISVILRAIDSTSGAPKTDFAYNTAGIDLWYRRNGGAVASITEATLAAVDSAHADGGVIHIGNGYFRLDSPDAAFATGANSVFFGGTATGVIIIGTEVQLVNHDVEDGVRLGLTALPNAAADAAGGLPISDAGALDLDTQLATLTNGTYGLSAIETLVDELESRLTAARAGYLDNLSAGAVALASVCTELRMAHLNADIDSRMETFTYTAPDNANITNIISAINNVTYGLNALLVAINSRLAATGYTAPNNSGIADIKNKTDQLSFTSPNKVDATATVSVAGLATEAKQDEIISDIAGVITHGDANWLTPSGIGGTIAITFNVKDDSGNNILDAVVEVWDTAGTTLKERKETNSSGNAVFNCKAETYMIKITKSGYSFTDILYTVTIPATVNCVMTAFIIPVSPDLTKCRVWMRLVNTYTSLTVSADVPENLAGNNLVMGSYTGVYDTVNNLVYWDIPIGAVNSVLKITELGFEVIVPLILDLESSELKDLI
jgi:hypothetical protein